MAYFQNVFPWEFVGNLVLGDRQASLSFRCPANTGRGDEIVQSYGTPDAVGTFALGGADLDGNAKGDLSIIWARDADNGFKNWNTLTVTVAGAIPASTTLVEIVTLLNANATFATLFTANVGNSSIIIRQKLPVGQFRFYIANRGAETALLFNKRAGLSEMPSYFDRHTMRRRFDFTDSVNHLIALTQTIAKITVAAPAVITSTAHGLAVADTITVANSNSTVNIDGNQVVAAVLADTFTTAAAVAGTAGDYGVWARRVDAAILTNAGLTLAGTQRDYKLLTGRSGLFTFTNVLANNGTSPTKVVEYPAGAGVGYLAKMIRYTYIGATTTPATITIEPYVLTAADLLTL